MKLDPKSLVELTDAALAADYTRVRRAANSFVRDMVQQGFVDEAKHLRAILRKRGVPLRASGYAEALPVDAKSRLPLIEEQAWPATPVFLDGSTQATVSGFLADANNVDLLSAKGISNRLCMLISGPPGTGKTLLAGHIAAQLNRPLYVVRLDSVISSLLGDTAKNIRSFFDFVPSKDGVLLLDEMDAIAKLRDDRQELGELKRVVNTVIQGLDSLDDHAVVIAATNHPQLLDSAIWRRFPYKIELGEPNESVRADLWRHFLFEDDDVAPLPPILAQVTAGLNGADIQMIALAARRQAVIEKLPLDIPAVVAAILKASSGRSAMSTPAHHLPTEGKKALARVLVREKGITQSDVARLLGVTRQAISGFLKGDDDAAA